MQQHQHQQSIILLSKYQQYLQNKPQKHLELPVHERMVYLLATIMEDIQSLPKGLSLLPQLTKFVNKVNIKAMSTPDMDFSEKIYLVSKCIDMLFYKPIRNNIRPIEKLLQLRALCFNNLSCMYKENKQLQDALKSLQVSLQIEQALLNKNYEDTYKSIASTYINKCVILSSLSRHDEAIQTIQIGLENIEKYRNRFASKLSQKEDDELKHMTMLSLFNLGAEHQHLGHKDLGIKCYKNAYAFAKQLGNQILKGQIVSGIKKLKKQK